MKIFTFLRFRISMKGKTSCLVIPVKLKREPFSLLYSLLAHLFPISSYQNEELKYSLIIPLTSQFKIWQPMLIFKKYSETENQKKESGEPSLLRRFRNFKSRTILNLGVKFKCKWRLLTLTSWKNKIELRNLSKVNLNTLKQTIRSVITKKSSSVFVLWCHHSKT